MSDWRPIEEANPQDGDMALILAEDTNGREVFMRGPQLCQWQAGDPAEGYDGWWVQMLRGDYYGLGCDGDPKLFMPVTLPAGDST